MFGMTDNYPRGLQIMLIGRWSITQATNVWLKLKSLAEILQIFWGICTKFEGVNLDTPGALLSAGLALLSSFRALVTKLTVQEKPVFSVGRFSLASFPTWLFLIQMSQPRHTLLQKKRWGEGEFLSTNQKSMLLQTSLSEYSEATILSEIRRETIAPLVHHWRRRPDRRRCR